MKAILAASWIPPEGKRERSKYLKIRFVNFVKDGEKRLRQFSRRTIVGNPRVILIDSLGNPRVILIDSLFHQRVREKACGLKTDGLR